MMLPPQFAIGVMHYRDFYSAESPHARIVIPVEVEGLLLHAILDTGAPWCVVNPTRTDELEVDVTAGIRASRPLNVRGIQYQGWICRLSVRLVAEKGQDLYLEPPVFIPEAAEWLLPNFVGLTGFLSNMRWAVDPGENLFYFGPL